MAYRAQPQSLFGNVGGPQPPRAPLDLPGAIDAIGGGAASIIHQTMLRAQARNQQALEQRRQQFAEKEANDRATERAQDFGLRQQEFAQAKARDDRNFLINGGIPGTPDHTAIDYTPTPMPDMTGDVSDRIAGAMRGTQGTTAYGAPAPNLRGTPTPSAYGTNAPSLSTPLGTPEFTPANRQYTDFESAPPTPARRIANAMTPTPAPVQAPTPSNLRFTDVAATPDTYDPEKAAAYVRTTETAKIRGEANATLNAQRQKELDDRQAVRLQANKDAAAVAQTGRIQLEKLKESGRTSGVGRALTPNALVNVARATADGIIAAHHGSYDEANQWIQSDDPEAVKLRGLEEKLPVSWGTLLSTAQTKWSRQRAGQVLPLTKGVGGLSIGEAGAAVDSASAPSPKPKPTNLVAPGAAPNASPVPVAAPSRARAPLSATQRALAKSDTGFAAHLKTLGYSDTDWK